MRRHPFWMLCVLLGLATGVAVAFGAPNLTGGLSVLFVVSESYAANVGVWSNHLDRLGYELTFAGVSETIEPYDPAGATIHVDCTLAELPTVSAFDAIVFATRPVDPGSISVVAQDLRSSSLAIDLLRNADAEGLAMYVGASAFGLLLDAGLVDGRSVLCHAALLKACSDAGGDCAASRSIDAPLRDRNLVTGTSWFAFPLEIVETIGRALDATQSFSRSLGSLIASDLALSRKEVELGPPVTSGLALGGPRADGAVSACLVPGGFALAGYTFSGSSGTADVLTMRFDDRRQLLWARALGGPGRDYGQAICATPDGGCVVAGFTTSAGEGSEDALLVRYAESGDVLWMKTFGGEGPDMALGVCATRDGGFAACGYTMSEGSGGSDLWVLRIDGDGNELWTATAGGSRNERGYAIEQEPGGGLCVVGSTTTAGGNYDGQVVRLTSDGQVVASAQTGWSSSNVFEDLAPNADGGLFAVGYGASQRSEGDGVVIASFDSLGARRWAKRIEQAATFDCGAGVLVFDSGDLLVCGSGSTTDPTESDALLMRLDGSGKSLWTRKLGDPARRERAEAMCVLETGEIVIVGHTERVASGSQDVLVLFVNAAYVP